MHGVNRFRKVFRGDVVFSWVFMLITGYMGFGCYRIKGVLENGSDGVPPICD